MAKLLHLGNIPLFFWTLDKPRGERERARARLFAQLIRYFGHILKFV